MPTQRRTALVTGGSKGIGLATARALLHRGNKVAISARKETDDVKALIQQFGNDSVLFYRADSSHWTEVRDLVSQVNERFNGIDILINNAGISDTHLGFEVQEKIYRFIFDTNVGGALATTAFALRPMVRNRWGRIINISSILAVRGTTGGALYGAAKAALIGYTISLAKELGPKGITVNSILPGYVTTEMTRGMSESHTKSIIRRTPIGRLGKVDDVIPLILFLVGDEAGFITGQSIVVDGGSTC